MSKFRTILLLIAVSITAIPCGADSVDKYVRARMHQDHIPGISLAVVKDGKVVKAQGYGLSNVELGTTAASDSVYQLASITKQFVATGIMMLVEEGKIRLDDKINAYVDGLPEAWTPITIQNLLTHTSGITRDDPLDPAANHTEEEVVKSVISLKLDFQPGERFSYSNLDYVLLGTIIRKVTGKMWDAFLTDRVFGPLGMAATRKQSLSDIVARRASGYIWDHGALKNAPAWPRDLASGGLLSTATDMAKWDAALYAGKLLKKSSLDRMYSPIQFHDGGSYPYGFGWFISAIRNHELVYHGGNCPGFTTNISRLVDDKLTVIVMANLSGADADGIAKGIARLYLPALAYKPIADTEPDVTARASEYLREEANGKVDAALVTQDYLKGIAPYLKEIAEQDMVYGPLKSLVLVERTAVADRKRYRYRATFANGTQVVLFVLTEENRIDGTLAETE